jgi:hypothetical protein
MLTIICGLALGGIVYFSTTQFAGMKPVSSAIIAVLCMLIFQVIVMLILRKLSGKINGVLQQIMTETATKLRSMQEQFMRRPMGGQKQMMQALEREQNAGLQRMIEALNLYKPLYLWNILMKKQVNTMRMMFLFQQKKFEEADALMDKCLFIEPQSVCVKMARMYKRNDEGIDKFFKKSAARFKGEHALMPYAVYYWILVKQDRIDDAIKVLNQAKIKTSDNEVIVKNWELLVNNKAKHFSNSLLGEQWYSLMLEEPKMPKQQIRYRR